MLSSSCLSILLVYSGRVGWERGILSVAAYKKAVKRDTFLISSIHFMATNEIELKISAA